MNFFNALKHTILLISVCGGFYANSQSINTFAKSYTKGGIGNTVRETADNGYVIVGGEDNYNFRGYDVWDPLLGSMLKNGDIFLMKTDLDGEIMWQKSYGTNLSREVGKWLEITSDGGYIIVGSSTFEQNVGQGAPFEPGTDLMDSSNIVLVKTDANGNLQWSKVYDTGGDDVAWCVQQTNDGGYIISAFCDTLPITIFGANGPFVMLIKTDANGNIQWEKKYDFGLRDAVLKIPFTYVVKQTNDGGYIVVGETSVEYISDMYVLRTDGNGVVQWANAYHAPPPFLNDHPGNSGGYDIIEASDNSFIIAGFRDSIPMDMQEVNNPYILKIDANGLFMGAKLYDYNTWMARTGFSSVQETSDGNLVFAGNSGYNNSGITNAILKTDLNLNTIWSRYYDMGAVILGGARCIREASDGGFTMTGRHMFQDVALLKMDSVGLINCAVPIPMTEIIPPVFTTNLVPNDHSGINEANWLISTDILLELPAIVCPVNCIEMADGTITAGLDYSIMDPAVDLTATDSGGVWSGNGITNELNGTFDPAIAGLGAHQVIHSFPGQCGDADTVVLIVSPVALPVKLLNFTALGINGMVQLDWETVTELNNDHFTVERSKSGTNWEEIGRVNAAGSSTSLLKYRWYDENPYRETSYYRLKQVDFDGAIVYSDIAAVAHDQLGIQRISVYPNPTQNRVTIDGQGVEFTEIRIYTTMNQEVSELSAVVRLTDSKYFLDLSNLPSGIYTVKTNIGTVRVIKY